MKYYIISFLILILSSCKDSQRDKVISILQEWDQKELQFPSQLVFTSQGKDTIEYSLQDKYKIITYVDSLGCVSCKLHLPEWKKFIQIVDSLQPGTVQFLFFFSPKKKKDIHRILLENRFKYPVCIDEKDSINILNHFPSNINFQTFLLDRDNKVVVVGNPIHNLKVKELYFKVITGKDLASITNEKLRTNVRLEQTSVDMGTFEWNQKQTTNFAILNTGEELLIVNEILTSCGCIIVEYSKEPIQPNKTLSLKVEYRAEHPEHFDKTITVYCSAKGSPFQLKIRGNAN